MLGETENRFSIESMRDGSKAIVLVNGEVDLSTAPQLYEHLQEIISTDASIVDLDLSQVGFLDSQGIGVIASIKRELFAKEGTLRLIRPQPPVKRALDITGIARDIEVIS